LDRVIITGGNGFIGRNLVKKLLSERPSSVAVIANTTNFNDNYFTDKTPRGAVPITFYTADIRDGQAISEIFLREKADTCFHLAAKINVADSIKNPDETMDINVKGTLNVLEACHAAKVKNFVFASSAAVYGDVSRLPISEDHALRPLSPYGISKMLAEQHVCTYNKLKKIQNTISLRIFNVYGHGQSNESDVISRFAKRLSEGLPPIIYGDGNHIRDFIYVDDVVHGMLLSVRAMESKDNDKFNYAPVFNMGSGNGKSINEIARRMISISGLELEPIYEKINHDSGVILHSYADMTKAKKDLHFVATKDLQTGLREIIEQKNDSQQRT
jgi:UDP-glucose 4-epimerase